MAQTVMFTLKLFALVSLLILLLLLSTLSVRNMDQVNFNLSLKNIPTPTKQEHCSELIHSVGIFVANLRWRSFYFLNPSNTDRKETFGFKTTEPAPSVAELKDFENDMYDLVKNVKFKHNVSNTLQNTLKQNMNEMKNESRMYVAADKTNNYYKMLQEKYNEMKLTMRIKKSQKILSGMTESMLFPNMMPSLQ